VVAANDEFFAEKENLIKPEPATHSAADFGHKGKVYDGWETRRRREPGHDWVIVRLGCQGIVHGVVVDTAFFTGNYPPEISVEAASAEGYPSPAELEELEWHELVGRVAATGDRVNQYPVQDRHRWTHIRLSIYPDGGVARFRAHGEIVPDPAFLTGAIDLAALENGGRVTGCSNAFYSSPEHLIMPGQASVARAAPAHASPARHQAPLPDRLTRPRDPRPPGRNPRRRPVTTPPTRRAHPGGIGRRQRPLDGDGPNKSAPAPINTRAHFMIKDEFAHSSPRNQMNARIHLRATLMNARIHQDVKMIITTAL
jgi:hypothetical protein